MIDFTYNPIIPADYKSRGRGLPYEASPFGDLFRQAGQPLKGLFLCFLVHAPRKRVHKLFYTYLIRYLIFL